MAIIIGHSNCDKIYKVIDTTTRKELFRSVFEVECEQFIFARRMRMR